MATEAKGYRGMAMEGSVARWYARTRSSASQIADWRRQAAQVTAALPDGADVLEVAPGPGYFSIEIARLGRFHVTGLDISRTFVEIASTNARQANVTVTFREGSASQMPFPDGSFDLVVCQAAFKNFSRPQAAVDETYRVLRPGGVALIQDMRHDATNVAIREEVRGMGLAGLRAWMTRGALRSLRRRAYSADQFRQFAQNSPFKACQIAGSGIGLDVTLRKPTTAS